MTEHGPAAAVTGTWSIVHVHSSFSPSYLLPSYPTKKWRRRSRASISFHKSHRAADVSLETKIEKRDTNADRGCSGSGCEEKRWNSGWTSRGWRTDGRRGRADLARYASAAADWRVDAGREARGSEENVLVTRIRLAPGHNLWTSSPSNALCEFLYRGQPFSCHPSICLPRTIFFSLLNETQPLFQTPSELRLSLRSVGCVCGCFCSRLLTGKHLWDWRYWVATRETKSLFSKYVLWLRHFFEVRLRTGSFFVLDAFHQDFLTKVSLKAHDTFTCIQMLRSRRG